VWQDPRVIVERIGAFVAAPRPAEFEALALAAHAFQLERVPALAAHARRRGGGPAATWRDVPLVPAAAFASVELAAAPAVETFRSSGTLGAERSVHRHPFPDLYRAVVDATFPRYCLPPGPAPPMLALVPPRAVAPDSSLAFMVDHALARFGGTGSAWACGARGVEGGAARSWLSARQREHRPALVLATSFALADLLDFLERIDLKFRLPAGSLLFETGGLKGRTKALDPAELHARVERRLGLGGAAIVAEYGMTELTSHAYTETLAGGDPERFVVPPWMRVRALDPETLAELPDGERGLLAFFDLANVGSALHVLTEDLGATDSGGFRLAGRAPDAALRGCSLLAEELARG
jgi:hypothetical protein